MAAYDLINVYDPTFWAQETLAQLFPQLKVAGMFFRDFQDKIAESGDVVNTRMPNKFVAVDVNPDSFASVKPTADNVQVKLDTWKQVVFEIGDREASLSLKGLQEEFMFPAAQAIGEVVERACIAAYKDVYQTVGVAGTTPATVAALGTDIKQAFDVANIPEDSRMVVLGPKATNKFNQVFYQDYVSGSPDQQTTGQLRPKFGMQYTDSNMLPTQTIGTAWAANTTVSAGVAGGTVTVNAAQTAPAQRLGQLPGSGTINLAALTASSTIKQGDVFIIGGQNYTVLADTTSNVSGQATVLTSPVLQADISNGQAVTNFISHEVNLGFHKQAFSLVSRPMKVPNAPGANVTVQSFNGLGLRSSVWYEPKDVRTYVRLDILFGVKTLDARKAFRILG